MQNKRQEVMAIMNRINRKLVTVNNNNDNSFIGKGQMNILIEIINHEKITQDQLASNLNLDKTTIAKAVKRLETFELITRNRSETDLRKKELVATDKAFVVKEHMIEYLEEMNKIFFDGITQKEIETFKTVLEKIEKNIETEKNIKNKKKQIAMKIINYIEKNEGVTVQNISELLGTDTTETNDIVKKLIFKKFLEEKNGELNLTQNAKEALKEHQKS